MVAVGDQDAHHLRWRVSQDLGVICHLVPQQHSVLINALGYQIDVRPEGSFITLALLLFLESQAK